MSTGPTRRSEVLVTEIPERVPSLTQRERDVLLALFQPAVEGEVFAEPASSNTPLPNNHRIAQVRVETVIANPPKGRVYQAGRVTT